MFSLVHNLIWSYKTVIKSGDIVMKISVSEFKTKCTKFIRDVANLNQTIEI